MFADSTRVRILYALMESELCVCDISDLEMSQSAISHQLRVLKQSRLACEADGKQYSILYVMTT